MTIIRRGAPKRASRLIRTQNTFCQSGSVNCGRQLIPCPYLLKSHWGTPIRNSPVASIFAWHQGLFLNFATELCKTLDMVQQVGQRIGYARVSSTDRNLARQLTDLGEVNRLFEEKKSRAQRAGRLDGDDRLRPRRGTVVVSSMGPLIGAPLGLWFRRWQHKREEMCEG